MSRSQILQRTIAGGLALLTFAILAASAGVFYTAQQVPKEAKEFLAAVEPHELRVLDAHAATIQSRRLERWVVPPLIKILARERSDELKSSAFYALLLLDPRQAALQPREYIVNSPPIQSKGQPVTANQLLAPGLFVEIEWASGWWAGRVVSSEPDGQVKVHYLGWSGRYDEIVPRQRLKVRLNP